MRTMIRASIGGGYCPLQDPMIALLPLIYEPLSGYCRTRPHCSRTRSISMNLRVLSCLVSSFVGLVPAHGAEPAVVANTFNFRDVTEAAGLIQPLTGLMGHGGAWGDFDGDG